MIRGEQSKVSEVMKLGVNVCLWAPCWVVINYTGREFQNGDVRFDLAHLNLHPVLLKRPMRGSSRTRHIHCHCSPGWCSTCSKDGAMLIHACMHSWMYVWVYGCMYGCPYAMSGDPHPIRVLGNSPGHAYFHVRSKTTLRIHGDHRS